MMLDLDTGHLLSAWPAALCMAVAFAVVRLPIFRSAETCLRPSSRARAIDGLRGFLALSVFVHHAAYYRGFVLDGVWGGEVSRLYKVCGPIGVSMFFMITGYLFWSKMIHERGRPDWARLYIGRLFRIGPLYLVVILALLAYVAVATGGAVNVEPAALLRQVARWLALGMVKVWDVNEYQHTSVVIAGVTWSLRWEWYFYGSLVLTSFAARRPGLHMPFALAAFAGCLVWSILAPDPQLIFVLLFSIGMACASAQAAGYRLRAAQAVSSVLALALVAACVALGPSAYTPQAALLLGAAFYLIAVSGSTLFGVLVSRAALRLGELSFGIYLLHGLVLTLVLRTELGRFAAATSPMLYWPLILGSIVVLLAVALLAYVTIEQPGIALGRSLADWVARRPWTSRQRMQAAT